MKDISSLIKDIKKENKLVIVEGKKDKKALESLGIKNIKTISKPLFKLVEEIKEKEVVILTDLDKEGRKLYSKLKKDLTRNGKKVDDKLRKELFKTKLRQIEGINNLFD